MAKRNRKTCVANYVTIALAEDWEHARDYQKLLLNYEIPALAAPKDTQPDLPGVPVMVPEEFAEQARAIVEFHNSPDDFYSFDLMPEPDFESSDDLTE